MNRKKVFARPCLVALGGNLPFADNNSPQQTCERALRSLHTIVSFAETNGALRPAVRSRWFSSAPVPASDQPRFVNGVARLWTTLEPEALLQALQSVESEAGRRRSLPNAARTLDLDLIDLDGCMMESPHLTLPHPRAHVRAFVLLPLRDVAPDWVHPISGQTVQALLEGLPAQDVRAL